MSSPYRTCSPRATATSTSSGRWQPSARLGQERRISGVATIRVWAARIEPPVRVAALLVGLFTVALALVGLVSPDSVTALRRHNFGTPTGTYAAATVRLAMGLVVILAARASRAPKTLRLLGALMCMQGL